MTGAKKKKFNRKSHVENSLKETPHLKNADTTKKHLKIFPKLKGHIVSWNDKLKGMD